MTTHTEYSHSVRFARECYARTHVELPSPIWYALRDIVNDEVELAVQLIEQFASEQSSVASLRDKIITIALLAGMRSTELMVDYIPEPVAEKRVQAMIKA